ncbi:hypothetical protein DPMN_131840 [Dreissena polymorpha]|uniref:Uncharacterized protein n=1 Tax=Dreissena polymorpha TaxID=45954 RepID=A0A9D4FV17_DREPO|nr:hypothetical protein DPMN_131840 [Dreissena polymorpha]
MDSKTFIMFLVVCWTFVTLSRLTDARAAYFDDIFDDNHSLQKRSPLAGALDTSTFQLMRYCLTRGRFDPVCRPPGRDIIVVKYE